MEPCLYHLSKAEYEMLKLDGYECVCSKCNYFRQRVLAKKRYPIHVYENEIFQQSLRRAALG